jgi:hypothetical protein
VDKKLGQRHYCRCGRSRIIEDKSERKEKKMGRKSPKLAADMRF